MLLIVAQAVDAWALESLLSAVFGYLLIVLLELEQGRVFPDQDSLVTRNRLGVLDLLLEDVRADDVNFVEVALVLLTDHKLLLNYVALGLGDALEHMRGQSRLPPRLRQHGFIALCRRVNRHHRRGLVEPLRRLQRGPDRRVTTHFTLYSIRRQSRWQPNQLVKPAVEVDVGDWLGANP